MTLAEVRNLREIWHAVPDEKIRSFPTQTMRIRFNLIEAMIAGDESAAFACQSEILQRALRCMSNGDRQQDDHLAGYEFGCHSNQRYRRLIALPGVATTTKAFAALAAGSNGPKLFPAEASSPAVLKAIPASSSFSNARHSG